MNKIVISDTTALIVFAKSDTLFLLSNLFQKVYIPKAVYDELMAKEDIVKYRIKTFGLLEQKFVSNVEIFEKIKLFKLDKGEAEAISLALELDLMLIIDEKKGRKIALNQGLKIVGTLGVLIENYRKRFVSYDELKLNFLLFKEQGLRISEELEKVFFEKLKKEKI